MPSPFFAKDASILMGAPTGSGLLDVISEEADLSSSVFWLQPLNRKLESNIGMIN